MTDHLRVVDALEEPQLETLIEDPAQSLGRLAVLAASNSETLEFTEAANQKYPILCQDEVTRIGRYIPPSKLTENPPTLVVFPAWSVANGWGLGRKNLQALAESLPEYQIIAVGNEGTESSRPSKRWRKDATFMSMAAARLDYLQQFSEQQDVKLGPMTIVAESMGTINAFGAATIANAYGLEIKKIVALAPAGIDKTNLIELGRKFLIPEMIDLFRQIPRVPMNELPDYMQTLIATGYIKPSAIPTLLRQGQLIAEAPVEDMIYHLEESVHIMIIAGTEDFVANPESFYKKLVEKHPNSQLREYEGDRHMAVTHAYDMAARAVDCINGEYDPLVKRVRYAKRAKATA